MGLARILKAHADAPMHASHLAIRLFNFADSPIVAPETTVAFGCLGDLPRKVDKRASLICLQNYLSSGTLHLGIFLVVMFSPGVIQRLLWLRRLPQHQRFATASVLNQGSVSRSARF